MRSRGASATAHEQPRARRQVGRQRLEIRVPAGQLGPPGELVVRQVTADDRIAQRDERPLAVGVAAQVAGCIRAKPPLV